MSRPVDIKLALGQGNAIRGVHNVKPQTFEQKKRAAARDRKQRKKKKGTGSQKPASFDKGGVRDDGTKGAGSREQGAGSKENDSEVRGSLVDVII